MYENLQREAEQLGIDIYEKRLHPRTKGLYSDNIIWINRAIPTRLEKICILAEELGHHHTTFGDITDMSIISNRKQENRARTWAYEKLVPLTAFIEAHKTGVRNRHELADQIGVPEKFLEDSINRYTEKYGMSVTVGNHTICFDPLGVLEMFE